MKVSVHHYPDRPAPPPPPHAPSSNHLSPSTDDMSATLLKANEANEDQIKRELFGNFKGFSLKPLPMSKPNIIGANVAYVHPVAKTETTSDQCIPIRAAPLPPSNSPKKSQIKSSPKANPKSSPSSFRYQNINASPSKTPETPIEVKLFASKIDAKERPKISHPILENSTCSVKELIATANANQSVQKNFNTLPKNKTVEIKPSDPQATLKKVPFDKNAVKKLEISAPVKAVTFGRSQSMRSPSTEKSPVKRNVLASGSMRHPPGTKRTNSVDRPKNPPPPRPTNLPNSAASSMRNIYSNMNGSQSMENSTDNIYCVIEDVKEASPPTTNGLLSEIVNEIENRNKNSIYSTTKKNTAPSSQTTYENVGHRMNIAAAPADGETEAVPGSNNIYMNTNSAVEQSPSHKLNNVTSPIEKTHKPNVNSIVKKLSSNSTAGTAKPSKPVIASKPTIGEQKKAPGKETSQPNVAKVAGLNVTKTGTAGKAIINPTSSVRAMHKRFENR